MATMVQQTCTPLGSDPTTELKQNINATGISARKAMELPVKKRARIKALAIPPAYENVWVSRSASGFLQATGSDAKGRKQYRCHPHWRES